MAEFPNLELFLAGGAVRDVLLDQAHPRKDFDFFIDGVDPEWVIAILGRLGTVSWGPFGSPRWFPAGSTQSYCDIIHIRRFWNGVGHCQSIVDALRQFDFTANAVAIDVKNGTFFDPVSGSKDIERHVMRAVRLDYPDEPISELCTLTRLSVLWFRILHYAAICRLKIEVETRKWLIRNSAYREDYNTFATVFFTPHEQAFSIVDKRSRAAPLDRKRH